jgi:hypothetical protein
MTAESKAAPSPCGDRLIDQHTHGTGRVRCVPASTRQLPVVSKPIAPPVVMVPSTSPKHAAGSWARACPLAVTIRSDAGARRSPHPLFLIHTRPARLRLCLKVREGRCGKWAAGPWVVLGHSGAGGRSSSSSSSSSRTGASLPLLSPPSPQLHERHLTGLTPGHLQDPRRPLPTLLAMPAARLCCFQLPQLYPGTRPPRPPRPCGVRTLQVSPPPGPRGSRNSVLR